MVSGEHHGTVGLWDIDTGLLIRELRPDRHYERMDITGLTGITNEGNASGIGGSGAYIGSDECFAV